jgi:hypothetical protein
MVLLSHRVRELRKAHNANNTHHAHKKASRLCLPPLSPLSPTLPPLPSHFLPSIPPSLISSLPHLLPTLPPFSPPYPSSLPLLAIAHQVCGKKVLHTCAKHTYTNTRTHTHTHTHTYICNIPLLKRWLISFSLRLPWFVITSAKQRSPEEPTKTCSQVM